MKGRAGPGQGSLPPAGSPRVPGVSARAGSRSAPRVVSPALTGARQARRGLGGAGVPGSWRPAPLTALFLVTILSSLRAIRAISSSLPIIASGAAPPAPAAPVSASRPRRRPRPSPPPAPAAADAALQRAGDPRFKPPASRPPRCILGHVVPAPSRLAHSLPALDHTSQEHAGAHSFLGMVVLMRAVSRPTGPNDSQSHKPSRGRVPGGGRCGVAWG